MKTALVTGANKGIGFETVKQLLALSYKVILTARNKEKGLAAVDNFKEYGENIIFIQMDVADEESIEKAARKFGTFNLHLDVIINNAGILLGRKNIIEEYKNNILETFITNTLGPILVIQKFLKYLNDNARIINVSSGLGSLNEMSDYAPAYSISKAALNAVTKQLSFSLKSKNISVNSVSPGWVKTDMGGPFATRELEEGAETIVWLATKAPQEYTGMFFRDKKELLW